MKKVINLLTVIIIFATVFTSCEKMEINQEQTASDPVLTKILNFKKKIENSENVKSDEMMSVDSAVWYIEALLNYKYCVINDSSEVYTETYVDSVFRDVQTSDNMISLMDVIEDYQSIEYNILFGLNKIKSDNKRVNIVDVSYKNGEIATYFLINYDISNKKGSVPDTHIYGDWHWGAISIDGTEIPQGNCDWQYYGQKDASTEINRVVHYVIAPPYNVYFTDVNTIQKGYNPNDPDWYLFYRPDNPYYIWTPENCQPGGEINLNHSDFWTGIDACDSLERYHPCINEEELNWYKNGAIHAINQIKANLIPSGFAYKDFHFFGTGSPSQPAESYYYSHSLVVYYGIPHSNIQR